MRERRGSLRQYSVETDRGNTGGREIRVLRKSVGDRVHFWPFDGWMVPPNKSAVVEVYPALWSHSFPRDGRDSHQQDAYAAAEWLRRNDQEGNLERFFSPSLTEHERKAAEIEGWILGIA